MGALDKTLGVGLVLVAIATGWQAGAAQITEAVLRHISTGAVMPLMIGCAVLFFVSMIRSLVSGRSFSASYMGYALVVSMTFSLSWAVHAYPYIVIS